MRARGAPLGAVLVAQAAPAAAAPRILLRSGDAAADGLHLDGSRLPAASSAGQVALLATTSGILREDGGVLSVVAKPGDPLAAPLAGAFGSLSGAAIADGGAIAFAATLDSPSAGAGIFVATPAESLRECSSRAPWARCPSTAPHSIRRETSSMGRH